MTTYILTLIIGFALGYFANNTPNHEEYDIAQAVQ